MARLFVLIVILLFAGAGVWYFLYANPLSSKPASRNPIPDMVSRATDAENKKDVPKISVVAKNLEVPWAIALLPDGGMLVTERPGRVRLIDASGNLLPEPVATIDVKQQGESGLHGITIHPNFSQNQYVYFYYTYESSGNETQNRVVRYKFNGTSLSEETTIVDQIPGAVFHDGGRIKFGPDNLLYITTGDAQEPSLAQNRSSLAGKILRVNDAGNVPPGNPFDSPIYSYGHRNPQGIAWDGSGRLWETEHGNSATDEVNLIESGNNYGWPTIRGNETRAGMITPQIQSGSSTWAPGDAAVLDNSLFFAGLRGEGLFEIKLGEKPLVIIEHFKGELGRIREVVASPDGFLYITTSNRDGRGNPSNEDDMVLRVNPTKL